MRQRTSDYYLEQISSQPISLHADGTVGVIKPRTINKLVERESRVPGRFHTTEITIKQLAIDSVYSSLPAYIATNNQQRRDQASASPDNKLYVSWTLDDVPQTVRSAYEAWCAKYTMPTHQDLLAAAVRSGAESDHDQTVVCQSCAGTAKPGYACHQCFTSGEFYKYPLVRLVADDGTVCERTFDVRQAIIDAPDSISATTDYSFSFEKLSGARSVYFDADKYVYTDEAGRNYRIDAADKLYPGARAVLDSWSEAGGHKVRRAHRSPGHSSTKSPAAAMTPDNVLDSLQNHIAQHIAMERPAGESYQAKLQKLIHGMGEKAMLLTVQFAYHGMGESGFEVRAALQGDDGGLQQSGALGDDYDIRQAIAQAYSQLY